MGKYQNVIKELLVKANVDLTKLLEEEFPKREAIEQIADRIYAIVDISNKIKEANENRRNAVSGIERAILTAQALSEGKTVDQLEKEQYEEEKKAMNAFADVLVNELKNMRKEPAPSSEKMADNPDLDSE